MCFSTLKVDSEKINLLKAIVRLVKAFESGCSRLRCRRIERTLQAFDNRCYGCWVGRASIQKNQFLPSRTNFLRGKKRSFFDCSRTRALSTCFKRDKGRRSSSRHISARFKSGRSLSDPAFQNENLQQSAKPDLKDFAKNKKDFF